jgi:hypothetical protein
MNNEIINKIQKELQKNKIVATVNYTRTTAHVFDCYEIITDQLDYKNDYIHLLAIVGSNNNIYYFDTDIIEEFALLGLNKDVIKNAIRHYYKITLLHKKIGSESLKSLLNVIRKLNNILENRDKF